VLSHFSLPHILISLTERVSYQAGLRSDTAHQKTLLPSVKQQGSSLQRHTEAPLPSRTGTAIVPVPIVLIKTSQAAALSAKCILWVSSCITFGYFAGRGGVRYSYSEFSDAVGQAARPISSSAGTVPDQATPARSQARRTDVQHPADAACSHSFALSMLCW